MTRRMRAAMIGAAVSLTLLAGCATVEPWDRGALGSEAMKLDDCRSHRFERNVEVYREGAAGGNGGKSGGGCGCS